MKREQAFCPQKEGPRGPLTKRKEEPKASRLRVQDWRFPLSSGNCVGVDPSLSWGRGPKPRAACQRTGRPQGAWLWPEGFAEAEASPCLQVSFLSRESQRSLWNYSKPL